MEEKKKKPQNGKKGAEPIAVTPENKQTIMMVLGAALAVLIIVIIIIAVVTAGGNSNQQGGIDGGEGVGDVEEVTEYGTGACEYLETRDISGRDIKYVEMSVKGYGKLVILLDATTAPITVANFLSLVEDGFYDGLTFHRIIKDFMIQGGDPEGDGTGGSDKEIFGEFSANGFENDISHKAGVISMARGNDVDSASSQFFICNADASSSLDGRYAAFGYVVQGMSIVEKITKDVFPKTAYADYYGSYEIDYEYGTYKQVVWQYLGNGAVEKDSDKPVIEYIKVLDSWEK